MNTHIFSLILANMLLCASSVLAQAGTREMAENGYARAQVDLGGKYLKGEAGLPQSSTEAAKWFRRAAEQGNPEGQALLAALYLSGNGVPRDYVEAYKWSNLCVFLATELSTKEFATKMRHDLENAMTPEQIAEAQRLSRDWKVRSEK